MQVQPLLHPRGVVDALNFDGGHARRDGGGGVAVALFVLLTAILFLRPTETIDSLASLPLYEIVFLLCTAFAVPALGANLGPAILVSRPSRRPTCHTATRTARSQARWKYPRACFTSCYSFP